MYIHNAAAFGALLFRYGSSFFLKSIQFFLHRQHLVLKLLIFFSGDVPVCCRVLGASGRRRDDKGRLNNRCQKTTMDLHTVTSCGVFEDN